MRGKQRIKLEDVEASGKLGGASLMFVKNMVRKWHEPDTADLRGHCEKYEK
jgi:hypothetical protein